MKKSVFILIILVLLGALLYMFMQRQEQSAGEIELVEEEVAVETCRVTNCHGVDVTCGFSEPIFCTMMQASGDICRAQAACEVVQGKCQAVYTQEHLQCRTCVETCQDTHGDDDQAALQCEADCSS